MQRIPRAHRKGNDVIDGIKIIECPWLEPGKAYLVNESVFKPLVFPIEPIYDGRLSDQIDAMRYAMYSICKVPDRMLILDSDSIDWCPTITKRWSAKKHRGPRRKSRRGAVSRHVDK
jgi:hypothetical protein